MALSDHGQYSGVVDIARNGIDEVIRLKAQAKQDDALIQQLAEAILEVYPHLSGLAVASDEALKLFQQQVSAIAAARARLEGKP